MKPIYPAPLARQPFWRRKLTIAITGLVILLVVVLALLVLRSRKDMPVVVKKPLPVPIPKPIPFPTAAPIEIPGELGGQVRPNTLVKLYTAAQRLKLDPARNLTLRMAGQNKGVSPRVTIGDEFNVKFLSSHPCYYSVFHVDSTGTWQLASPKMPIGPDDTARTTDLAGKNLSADATSPGGSEGFLFVCADKKIDLEAVVAGDPRGYTDSFDATILTYFVQEKAPSEKKQ